MYKPIIAVLTASVMLFLTGCGADWDQSVKEGVFIRQYMVRDVKVINAVTGDVLKDFRAKSYISDKTENGNVTITYYDSDGELQKIDIIGNMAIVITDTVNDQSGSSR